MLNNLDIEQQQCLLVLRYGMAKYEYLKSVCRQIPGSWSLALRKKLLKDIVVEQDIAALDVFLPLTTNLAMSSEEMTFLGPPVGE